MMADLRKRSARGALAVGILGFLGGAGGAANAAVRIDGQVQAGGGGVAGSTVTLWAASAGDPRQLAQAKTGDDGSYALNADATPGPGESLYLIAKGGVASVNKGAGDNPALAFLAVLGGTPPATCHDQRDDDRRIGLDQRAVPRRRGDQGASAEFEHRGRQCAQLCRSPDGRLWRNDCGRTEQHADADPRQLRHAVERAGGLRHSGDGQRLRQSVSGGDAAERQGACRHAHRGRVRRPRIPGTIPKRSLPCWRISILCRRASPCCGQRLSCRI